MHDQMGYYTRLGVKVTAGASEIKAAYHRLAKQLHPDVNSTLEAHARFQKISEAYSILGNPEKRANYDTLGYVSQPTPAASRSQASTHPAEATKKADPVCCSRCGKPTAQPRPVVFWYVVSFILFTRRVPLQGIYCAACARIVALRASFISATAGWWGFPWGPIFTVAHITRNAFGGTRIRQAENRLLWYNAVAFFTHGNLALAYALARQLRSTADQTIRTDAARLMDHLQAAGVSPNLPRLKNPWRLRPLHILANLIIMWWIPLSFIALSYQHRVQAWWTEVTPLVRTVLPLR